MNLKDIENHIDRIKPIKKRSRKHTKKLVGLPLIWWVLIVATILVSAVLIANFNYFYATQTQDIEVEGVEYLLQFDGVPFTSQSMAITPDAFSDNKLEACEVETFTHTITSDLFDGNWRVSFDISSFSNLIDEATEEFYGYYFSVNDSLDADITTTGIDILAGETKTIKFRHELDCAFLDTTNLMPFDLQIDINEIFEILETIVGSGSIGYSPEATGGYWLFDTSVELTATPNTDWEFTAWSGDIPTGEETTNPLTITMDSDKDIIATFTELFSHTIWFDDFISNTATYWSTTGGATIAEEEVHITASNDGVVSNSGVVLTDLVEAKVSFDVLDYTNPATIGIYQGGDITHYELTQISITGNGNYEYTIADTDFTEAPYKVFIKQVSSSESLSLDNVELDMKYNIP